MIFASKSSKIGWYWFSASVLTKTGVAPVTDTKSGKDTQYGVKIITSSPASNKAWHAL